MTVPFAGRLVTIRIQKVEEILNLFRKQSYNSVRFWLAFQKLLVLSSTNVILGTTFTNPGFQLDLQTETF